MNDRDHSGGPAEGSARPFRRGRLRPAPRLAAIAIAAVACNYSHVTVPLSRPEARSCTDTCAANYAQSRNPSWYRACLATCPGAQSAKGKCAAAEQPPVAVCAEDGEVKGVLTAAIVIGAIGFMILGAVYSAAGGIRDTINN
jgi:hypothetical protein